VVLLRKKPTSVQALTELSPMGRDNLLGPKKPTGRTGPIHFSAGPPRREIIEWPNSKKAIESTIATMFVDHAGRMPIGLAPFSDLRPNDENDLDFTIATNDGDRLLELAEFAPLAELKAKYESAPKHIPRGQFFELVHDLIMMKSVHQGGAGRLLLLYNTHARLFIDPIAMEAVRRKLNVRKPNFDAIYSLSPKPQGHALVWELWPGQPHPFYERRSDAELAEGYFELIDLDDLIQSSSPS